MKAKRVAAKKPAAMKPAAKKPAAMRAIAKRRGSEKAITALPTGYDRNPAGVVLLPSNKGTKSLTPASKLREGLSKAQNEIKESLQEIATLMTMDFEVAEIEFSISFSADGKFLGFGVGGATSIKVKIKPVESETDA